MNDTPQTDELDRTKFDRDPTRVIYFTAYMDALGLCRKLERQRNEAAELLAEIMRDEVNPQDEAEKWLRAYAPQHLFQNERVEARPDQSQPS